MTMDMSRRSCSNIFTILRYSMHKSIGLMMRKVPSTLATIVAEIGDSSMWTGLNASQPTRAESCLLHASITHGMSRMMLTNF